MQRARFVMNHPAAHWDGVAQDFIGDAELFQGVNPSGREREVDRPTADKISRARIGPAFVKIDIVPAPPQVRGEQSAGESAADENKFRIQSKKARTKSTEDTT